MIQSFKKDVNVQVTTTSGSDMVSSDLSVSVVNQDQVISLEKYPQNILSYFLLGSELKGNIENPATISATTACRPEKIWIC